MSATKKPVHGTYSTLFIASAVGLAPFWMGFFTMLMRNSFMDGDIELLWYHLFLRIVFLTGVCVTSFVVARKADFLAQEQGHRLLKGGACMFSVVAAVSSLTAYSFSMTMPLVFDLFAWSLAGVGLACLLTLWIEIVTALKRTEAARCFSVSAALGGVAYLMLNLLPFPFNIGFLCVSPLLSLAMATILERDASYTPLAFVPLNESIRNAKLSPAYLGVSCAYGIVFGLGIGSTTQFSGEMWLYASVAGFLLLGALMAYLFLTHYSESNYRASYVQILFPILICALIPMSFLQGLPYIACNLLLLSGYVFFEMTNLGSTIDIAAERNASTVQLASINQATLCAGMILGHVIGLVATSTGIMNYSMLSAAALASVAILAALHTFAPIAPLIKHASPENAEDANDLHEEGHWKTRSKAIAREAGLSARETEVFMLLAKGRGTTYIQNALFISGHTVKTHVYNIYKKMGISSREQLLDAIESVEPDEEAEQLPSQHSTL